MSHMQQLQTNLPAIYGCCIVAFNRNLDFLLNVLCRTDRQTDGKINLTLSTIDLTQASVGSWKSGRKLKEYFKCFQAKKKNIV